MRAADLRDLARHFTSCAPLALAVLVDRYAEHLDQPRVELLA